MDRIFAKSTLREFWEKHSDSEQYLKTWYDTAMSSDWKNPADVKQTYANASILKDSRIVFNIKGNSHPLPHDCIMWLYEIKQPFKYKSLSAMGGFFYSAS
jgi:mRNA-degrading endonuclease HigB of HigAB toxin-antitoxin module